MTTSSESADRTNGRWTKLEHQIFLKGVQIYGKNWKKIEELLGTRSGAQIRSHAQKYFLKSKKGSQAENSQEQSNTIVKQKSTNFKKVKKNEPKKANEYSYFLEKIVQFSIKNQQFDFWSSFIDQESAKQSETEQTANQRKNSFMEFEFEDVQLDVGDQKTTKI